MLDANHIALRVPAQCMLDLCVSEIRWDWVVVVLLITRCGVCVERLAPPPAEFVI